MNLVHTTLPFGELQAAPYNPRTISEDELQKLVRSIREFGLVQPFTVRASDRLVIGGHQRMEALRRVLAAQGTPAAEIAAHAVPVVLVEGLDEPRTKALNLALNKISGEWDYAKLAALFEDFKEVEGFDATMSGWELREMEDISTLFVGALGTESTPTDDATLNEGLARHARRFTFEVPTDEDAAMVRAILQAHGATTVKDADAAFLRAVERLVELPVPMLEPKPTKKPRVKEPKA